MRKIEEKREERVEKALELLNQNLSLQDIAYELGVGEQTIRVYRRELIAQGRYEENYPRRSSQTPKFNIEKIENICKRLRVRENRKLLERYISDCRIRFSNKQLKKSELGTIEAVATATNSYDYMLFYVKASVHLGEFRRAKIFVNKSINNEMLLPSQKEKMKKLKDEIDLIIKKHEAVVSLREGKGVKVASENSGLSETEVAKINKRLIEKQEQKRKKEKIEKENRGD